MGPKTQKASPMLSNASSSLQEGAKSSPAAAQKANGAIAKVDVLRTYNNVFLEYSLMNEYAIFRKKFIPGVYIMPSFESALKWFCVLFVRSGVYEGGAFRLELQLSPLFPDGECPRVVFDPPVFHPMVHAITGEMDLSSKIPRWRRDENHIFEVIEAVKLSFEDIDKKLTKPSNKEAFKLYTQNSEEFKRVVEECVAQCMEHLQTEAPQRDDPNSFDFVSHDHHDLSLDESSLFSLRLDSSECSNEANKSPQRMGLSWMRGGRPFAKP